jgi:hypothetical protein
MLEMVPTYMPWRLFWVYFVGVALIAASLSIATKIQVRWSGLLLGIMMFLFVAMLYIPGALTVGGRFAWTVVFREMSFGGAGWVLAGIAMGEWQCARSWSHHGGPDVYRDRGDLFWRSAFSASAGASGSSARETDAHVDSQLSPSSTI